MYILKKYIPENMKLLDDGSIDMGSRILTEDIENMSLKDKMVTIVLKDDLSAGGSYANLSSPTPTPAGKGVEDEPKLNPAPGDRHDPNPTTIPTPDLTPKPTPASSEMEAAIAAIKATNSQLQKVMNEVKSDSGKNWVQLVISVNSKMIEDPDGDYSGDVNSAKAAYSKLPANVKEEVQHAAISNMDISAVRLLIKKYEM